MASNVGNQIVTLIYHTKADTLEVNRRFFGVRPVGIYSGGWLSIVDGSHAQISPLVCEIADNNYQVRVRTQIAVNLVVASATPYIVLRWTYTGVLNTDYMELLAVASPSTNDLVVGKCTFSGGGSLNGFNYAERDNPNVMDLFLKVEETGDSDLRVRVRAGRIQTSGQTIIIADQKSGLFTPPSANSKIYLVYIDVSTGAVSIDSSGSEAASPVPPSYSGKLVLAEVTLASTDTSIPNSQIEDKRSWLREPSEPDGTFINRDANGKLTVKRCFRDFILVRDIKASGTNGGTFTSGAWRTRDLTELTSDVGGHASLASNQITLAAGTYEFRIRAPAGLVGSHQVRLQNVSDGSTVTSGSVMYNTSGYATYYNVTDSVACGRFTIASSKVFEVQHRCQLTQATYGFGKACGFGSWEQYTQIELWRVA